MYSISQDIYTQYKHKNYIPLVELYVLPITSHEEKPTSLDSKNSQNFSGRIFNSQ